MVQWLPPYILVLLEQDTMASICESKYLSQEIETALYDKSNNNCFSLFHFFVYFANNA